MSILILTLRTVKICLLIHSVIVITEKPTQKRSSSSGAHGSTQEDIFALKKKLEVLTSIPKKKYPYPVTSAQEVGWDNDEVTAAPNLKEYSCSMRTARSTV
jgi:hypothetical protein